MYLINRTVFTLPLICLDSNIFTTSAITNEEPSEGTEKYHNVYETNVLEIMRRRNKTLDGKQESSNDKRQKNIEKHSLDNVRSKLHLYLNRADNNSLKFFVDETNIGQIIEIINHVIATDNRSSFPDFSFDRAFIEHFHISSSAPLGENGSEYFKEKKEYDKSVDIAVKELKQGEHCCPERENHDHSYDYLFKSFKTSWEKHIRKAEEVMDIYSIRVFLIEYNERELRNNIDNAFFRISNDKQFIELIKGQDIIDYVIFDNKEYVEILETKFLDKLLIEVNDQNEYIAINGGEKNLMIAESIPVLKFSGMKL